MKAIILFSLLIAIPFSTSTAQNIYKTKKGISLDSLICNWRYFRLQAITDSLKKHKCDFKVVKPKGKKEKTEIIVKNGDLSGFIIPSFVISHSETIANNTVYVFCGIDITLSHKDFDYKKLDTSIEHPLCALYRIGLAGHYAAPYEKDAGEFCESSFDEQIEKTAELLHHSKYDAERPRIFSSWSINDSNTHGSYNNGYGVEINEKQFLKFYYFILASENL